MKVKRIAADIARTETEQAEKFDRDMLGLELVMNPGWIATYGSS